MRILLIAFCCWPMLAGAQQLKPWTGCARRLPAGRSPCWPVSYRVDAEGRIRYSAVGEIDWTDARVRQAIDGLLPPRATQPLAALSASFR